MGESVPDALVGSAVERVVPGSSGVSPHLVREHVKRYDFASPLVKDLHVLDVACGAGYGSQILAAQAKSVVGVDLEPEAIRYAREHFAAPNVRFAIADAHTLGDFENSEFDAVISFETIEHLPDYRAYLASVRRVLRSGGMYIVSTPDRLFTQKARLPTPLSNPYHVHEFEREELAELLGSYFSSVELFGQQFYVEPPTYRKLIQSIALKLLASPLYQEMRKMIPRTLLSTGVKLSGIDNNTDICKIDARKGIPEILLAVCR